MHLGMPGMSAGDLTPTYDYDEMSTQSPYSSYNYSTPCRTDVMYTERSNVRFEIQDLCRGLEFPDSTFDVVHCRRVLTPGVTEWRAAIRELLRVLRPGGLLLIGESSFPLSLSVSFHSSQTFFYLTNIRMGRSLHWGPPPENLQKSSELLCESWGWIPN